MIAAPATDRTNRPRRGRRQEAPLSASLRRLVHVLKATRRHPLARRHTLRALFRFARLQLCGRTSGQALAVPFAGPVRLLVQPGQTGANGNHYWGLLEPEHMAFALHFLRPGELFVDAGANVGTYSLLASGVAGARSLAFEPVGRTADRLARNLALNALEDRVTLRRVCLGESAGRVRMTADRDTTNQIARPGETGPLVEVEMRRLDQELREAPRLLKIDTEGHDDAVLAGAGDLLAGKAQLALIVESLGDASRDRLADLGLRACRYDPVARRLEPDLRGAAGNLLFIRDLADAQARVAAAAPVDLHGFGQL